MLSCCTFCNCYIDVCCKVYNKMRYYICDETFWWLSYFAKIKLLIYFLLMPNHDSVVIPISRKEDLKLCTSHREIDIVIAPRGIPRLGGEYWFLPIAWCTLIRNLLHLPFSLKVHCILYGKERCDVKYCFQPFWNISHCNVSMWE